MQYEMLSERIGINLEVRLQSSDTDEGFLHVSNDLDKCSFPASILCRWTKSHSKTYSCLMVMNNLKEVLCIRWIQVSNIMHTIMAFVQSRISINPLIISLRLNQFTNSLTKTFIS